MSWVSKLVFEVRVVYVMNLMKEKALRLAESIRKQQRQELMISRRNWHQVPSPVFQLPYRIENSQWEHFQNLLDALSEKKNADLVEEGLKQYLLDQWQRISDPIWQNEAALNIIRVLFRLHIANRHHGGQLLGMASLAARDAGENQQAGEALLKMLKEVAINLEATANTISQDQDLWTGELRDHLNSFASSLKICRQAAGNPQFQRMLRDYHLYYLVLLADHRVSIEQFIRMGNVGELLLLINDSLDHRDNFYLRKAIQIIKKILNATNDEEINRSLEALSVFCISGIGTALSFLEGKQTPTKQSGNFFYHFISIAGNADAETLLQTTQLLALLFSRFDECIPAAFEVRIESIVHDDPQGIQVMRPKQHCTLGSLMDSLLEHLLIEVRVNGYWAISNVTGSALFFRKHGLPFIRHIYLSDFLHLESKQFVIQEITFCVLNYLCNITHPAEVEELAEIVLREDEGGKGSMPNCLLSCLEATANIIEDISNTSEYRSLLSEQYLSIIQRAVFALYMVLQHAGPLTDHIRCHLQRKGVEVHLERLLEKLSGQEQLCQSISVLQVSLQSKDSPL